MQLRHMKPFTKLFSVVSPKLTTTKNRVLFDLGVRTLELYLGLIVVYCSCSAVLGCDALPVASLGCKQMESPAKKRKAANKKQLLCNNTDSLFPVSQFFGRASNATVTAGRNR